MVVRVCRPGGPVVQLGPVERDRDGRPGQGPDGVGGGHRLGVAVAPDVQVQPATPLGDAALGGEVVGVAGGQGLGHGDADHLDGVGVGRRDQRHDHVQAARPARLEERGQPELVEQPVQAGRGQPEGPEVPGGRVEVEDHLVGVVDVGGAAEPDVRGDAALVGQVGEVVGGPADGVGDLVADGGLAGAAVGRGHPLDPVGEVPADLLLEEAAAADPVREPLQGHRAPADQREHPRRDRPVVGDQVALGDAVRREQHLLRMGDLDPVAHDGRAATGRPC